MISAGLRSAKLAKAKRATQPRRETRAARKRRREDAGDGNGDEDLEVLSGEELDLEELAGEPTESEFETAAGPTAGPSARPTQVSAPAKMCAGDKVIHVPICFGAK